MDINYKGPKENNGVYIGEEYEVNGPANIHLNHVLPPF